MTKSHRSRAGFTIIELSIVVVILGLLTGGILMGQSLIRGAEIKSVISDFQKYQSAAKQFRDQYNALPGDMANANSVWPTAVSGDGNGAIASTAAAAASPGEGWQFWSQLVLAGFIQGNYSGLSATSTWDDSIGVNTPASRITGAGWRVHSSSTAPNPLYYFSGNYGNYFNFGGGCSGCSNDHVILKPDEAWSIDTKIDDGVPGTGKVLSNWTNPGTACTNAGSNTAFTSSYSLGNSSISCFLAFPNFNK